jgi:DNA polymerase (family X)
LALSKNQDVVNLLYEIAQLLEIQGVQFKPRAYQRAAQNIETLTEDIEKLVAEERLGTVPGVGSAIEDKVTEFVKTGKLEYLEKLRKEVPPGLAELMQLPHVGPKTALRLYKELKIHNLAELEKALAEHRLQGLKGFGEKSESEIQKSLARQTKIPARRFDWLSAHEVAQALSAYMRRIDGLGRIEFAGSYRRGRDTVGDLDLLVEAPEAQASGAMDAFIAYRRVTDTLEKGTTRSRVLLDNGMQVDLRVVPTESFGAALIYFTGSKDHNIAVRSLALKKGYTLNEYALTTKDGGKKVASATEEEVYKRLGMAWVPPEIRENRGEVPLAVESRLPRLIEVKDIKGDLHVHTNESDGSASAKSMIGAARKSGLEYVGLSDHSFGLRIANGLSPERQAKQRKEIEGLRKSFPDIEILQGAETEILKDGSIDMTRADRAKLDYVIGSVHSAFKLERKEQTERVLKAMESGIDILGHPTGRRIMGKGRTGIDVDLEQVAQKAKQTGVLLEVDGTPDRLDLWGDAIHTCRAHGADFVIDSDAHSIAELMFVEYGVTQARRGWLTTKEVANSWPAADLRKRLGHSQK